MRPTLKRFLLWLAILVVLMLGWRLVTSAIDRSARHDARAFGCSLISDTIPV